MHKYICIHTYAYIHICIYTDHIFLMVIYTQLEACPGVGGLAKGPGGRGLKAFPKDLETWP